MGTCYVIMHIKSGALHMTETRLLLIISFKFVAKIYAGPVYGILFFSFASDWPKGHGIKY